MNGGCQKLVLGTAQFGLNYGISNSAGVTSFNEAERIASYLIDKGVFIFDTAPDYGESEVTLKNILEKYNNCKVITKIPSIKNDNVDDVIESIHKSISLFGSSIYGLLFHNPDDLLKPEFLSVIDEIKRLLLNGDLPRIGGSIYNEDQIYILNDIFKVDILQVPFNVFDQRLTDSKIIKNLRKNGCEIHVRSVFLQGLLLMQSSDLSSYFTGIRNSLDELRVLAEKNDTDVYGMCLKWVFQQDWVDRVVIGLNNNEQAEYLINNIQYIDDMNKVDLSKFNVLDKSIINPSRWP